MHESFQALPLGRERLDVQQQVVEGRVIEDSTGGGSSLLNSKEPFLAARSLCKALSGPMPGAPSMRA